MLARLGLWVVVTAVGAILALATGYGVIDLLHWALGPAGDDTLKARMVAGSALLVHVVLSLAIAIAAWFRIVRGVRL